MTDQAWMIGEAEARLTARGLRPGLCLNDADLALAVYSATEDELTEAVIPALLNENDPEDVLTEDERAMDDLDALYQGVA